MSYARMTSIRLQNFMGYVDTTFEFDDSGILQIMGYNSAGKTTVLHALDDVLYNTRPKEQIKKIRWGAKWYCVTIAFEDGVSISHEKFIDGGSVWTMRKDAEIVYTNRADNGIYATATVPTVIADYLAVMKDEDTGETLNLRNASHKKIGIQTTGGELYKLFSNALKAAVLTKASIAAIKAKNAAVHEEVELATRYRVLQDEYTGIIVADDDIIVEVTNSLKERIALLERQSLLQDVCKSYNDIESIVIYPELPLLDLEQFQALQNLRQCAVVCSQPLWEELTEVSLSRLQELDALKSRIGVLVTPVYDELPQIDLERVMLLRGVCESYNKQYTAGQEVLQFEAKLATVAKEYTQNAKAWGMAVCQSCGEAVMLDGVV